MNIEFKVPDMVCDVCAAKIMAAIKAIAPDAMITANSQTKLVRVTSNESATIIFAAVTQTGYTVQA